MAANLNKKKIIFASTISLTQNLFLNHLQKFFYNKGYDVYSICKDPENLINKNTKKIKIIFPTKYLDFLNLINIIKQIFSRIK